MLAGLIFLVIFGQHVFLQFYSETMILLKLANLQVRLFEILSSESSLETTYKTLLRLPWFFKRFLWVATCTRSAANHYVAVKFDRWQMAGSTRTALMT